jgi:RimJ/RimL family protein N-acetyltransferase
MDVPTLTTDRLVLRGLRASDWDEYAAMNADPEVRRWLSGTLLSREEAWEQMASLLGQWALRGYGIFAVESEGRLAGRVGLLHFADWPEPELSWTLALPFWGRGLATEAVAAVRRWAFATLRRDRLVSYIKPENVRSRRVAEKLGAVCDGQIVLRNVVSNVWVHPLPGHGVIV